MMALTSSRVCGRGSAVVVTIQAATLNNKAHHENNSRQHNSKFSSSPPSAAALPCCIRDTPTSNPYVVFPLLVSRGAILACHGKTIEALAHPKLHAMLTLDISPVHFVCYSLTFAIVIMLYKNFELYGSCG